MGMLRWGDGVMLFFLNGKSDGDGGSSCGGAAVKKKISSIGVDNKCSKDGNVLPPVPSPRLAKKKNSSRGVDDKCSKDGNVLPPVPSPRLAKKKTTSKGVDNKRSKDGNVLPPVPSPCPVKKKITSKGVDNKRTKYENVLSPVTSPHPSCNSENPCIMETRVYSGKKIKLRDEDCHIDQISRLPDELLVSILSCLSLKEAAASSILSRRWRFLWTFISKLDFEGSDLWTSFTPKPDFEFFTSPSQSKREASIRESWEYVRWVDDVLGVYNKSGAAIDELRISFSLHEAHQSYIDRWIEFALAKKVVRLDMNLVRTDLTKSCAFPHKLLCNNDSHSWGFKGLRLIRMVSVRLSDGALEIFLRSCPLLEEIFLAQCWGFSTVKIVNSLPALKRLTLLGCGHLKSVEVCDSNLVYFMYRGLAWPLKHFVLKNVPLLVEINVGGPVTEKVEEFLAMFSSCLPQLEKLTIHKHNPLSIMEADMICSSVKMSNLKQLVWKFVGFYGGINDLEGVAILVGASPLLQRLVVMSYADMLKATVDRFYNRKIPYKRTYTYSHLKQVEFVGYHGDLRELAILLHFLENAAALEEVSIYPAKDTFIKCKIGEYTEQEIDAFRSFAKAQLPTWLPSTVTLKIF